MFNASLLFEPPPKIEGILLKKHAKRYSIITQSRHVHMKSRNIMTIDRGINDTDTPAPKKMQASAAHTDNDNDKEARAQNRRHARPKGDTDKRAVASTSHHEHRHAT